MKETKTLQLYPSDSIINAAIEEWGSFGWEVVSNQRCQEYEGQTYGIDGSSTKHYSTFNKVTFTREKTAAWYGEVTQLEKEYKAAKSTADSYAACKPVLKKPGPEGTMGFALGFFLYALYIVPGIIYTIVRSCKKSKYKKQYQKALANYESVYPAKIRELNGKMAELRSRSEKCILGNV